MPISSLSVQQIVAVIRQQMAVPVRSRSADSKSIAAAASEKGKVKRGRHTKSQRSGLSNLIGSRVSALSDQDPERGRKAFRIFLESVLLNELGEDLINDPGFYQLVEDIHQQMENSPDIAQAMQQATAQLLAGSSADNPTI